MPCEDIASQIAALEAHISVVAYDDKQLAEAEKTLRRAFSTVVAGSESTSAFFAGMYRTENKKLLDSKMPAYLIDKDYPDERRDRWATQVHLKETARAKFSREPMDESDYLYASVHRIVNSLPEQYLVFIKAQFMPQGRERGVFLSRLLDAYWRDYQEKIPAGINRGVLFVFAETIIASSGGNEKFIVAMLKEKIETTKQNWYKRYLPQWKAMQGDYQVLRHRSLSAFLASS